METILVTGVNGLIGQNILLHLEKKGYKTIGISKSALKFSGLNSIFESIDLTDHSQFNYIADLYRPDIIIHCAAMSKPDECEKNKIECWEINVKAVENIAQYCAKHNVFLIHFSSDFVFSGFEGYYDETSVLNPLSVYGNSKQVAEQIVTDMLQDFSIIRTSLVYGTVENNLRSNLILWVLKNLKAETSIKVVADQYRTPTYDKDICNAVEEIIKNRSLGIFNIAGKECLSVYDIAIETSRLFGLNEKLIQPVSTMSLNEPAKRPPKTFLNIDRAIKELNYMPKSLIDGLSDLKNRL